MERGKKEEARIFQPRFVVEGFKNTASRLSCSFLTALVNSRGLIWWSCRSPRSPTEVEQACPAMSREEDRVEGCGMLTWLITS